MNVGNKEIKDMEELGKQLFNLQRFLILQTKLNPQTSDLISDDEAFAWSVGLYPLHSTSKIAKDLEHYFVIPKSMIELIIKYVDSKWVEKNYPSFYNLESYFANKSSSNFIIDRTVLIDTLRYCYLHGLFDENLWNGLVANDDCPLEAKGINRPFSTDEINL
jgi:hypothetical protein